MADLFKLAKVAEKAGEELIEHNPALAAKLLEETGAFGGAIKFVTHEFSKLAGAIETKGIFPNITHTFEREIRWKSAFVEGADAKSVSLCAKNFQTIENPFGITFVKDLRSTGGDFGADVLKLGPAPQFLREKGFVETAARGVPNWLHGSDDWIFHQAHQEFPSKVVLDDFGRLHAIEYLDEVKALAGPFKGLSGTRFEINHAADGLKSAKLKSLGGRFHGLYDEYEYEFGQPYLKTYNFDGPYKPYALKRYDMLPEDIKGSAHRSYDASSCISLRPLG